MRLPGLPGVLLTVSGCGAGPAFIPGSATLPACSDEPVTSLDGTKWFDQGTVTILTEGCSDATVGEMFSSCALDWVFSQSGSKVDIVVDDEYRIDGRMCGDQLHLRGGWWLPVEDAGSCTYDDDSADEVGIQARASTLTVTADQITGTLALKGSCEADYDVVFVRVP